MEGYKNAIGCWKVMDRTEETGSLGATLLDCLRLSTVFPGSSPSKEMANDYRDTCLSWLSNSISRLYLYLRANEVL